MTLLYTLLTFTAIPQLTMQSFYILSLGGVIFGIATIVLGIVALSTPTWIVLTDPQTIESTYSLFERCNKPLNALTLPLEGCTSLSNFQTAQGLIIAGVIIIGLSMIASILLGILVNKSLIKLVPPFLLITGSTLILIGAVFYVEDVLGNFTTGSIKLDLGYSFILILVTCIIGYTAAAYFVLTASFTESYHGERIVTSQGTRL